MSDQAEVNMKVARDFFAAMDAKRFDDMADLIHEDHKFIVPGVKEPMGKKEHMAMNIAVQNSLSDLDRHYLDQFSAGDKVCSRMLLRMKHIGEFNGVPPSNEYIDLEIIHIMQIKEGKNYLEWDAMDTVPLLKALNYIPKETQSPFE